MSSGSSRCTGPGRSSFATRKASRTRVGNAGGADDLARQLGQRLHRRDDVDDLEARLPAAHDRLLAGDHHHRHGAEMGIGRAGREVQRARTERRDAHARLAGEPAVGRRHERRGLLVAGQDQLDPGGPQRFHDIEIFLARDAEDAIDAFVLERGDKKIGSFGHRYIPFEGPSFEAPVSGARGDTLHDGLGEITGGRGAAQVAGADIVLVQYGIDRLPQVPCLVDEADVVQHQAGGEQQRGRVGEALARDIRRRAVHRFEDGGFLADVGTRAPRPGHPPGRRSDRTGCRRTGSS